MKKLKWNLKEDPLLFVSLIVNSIMYFLSGFFPRRKNRLLFGAWGGNKYSDNPRFLLEDLLEKHGEEPFEFIWVGKKHLLAHEIFKNQRVTWVQRNSLKSFYYQLTCEMAFFANSYRDFGYLNLLKGATVFQLWHGFGPKKTQALKANLSPMKKYYYQVGSKSFECYDYFISSSPMNTQKIMETFSKNGIESSKIIPSGQPKNQRLIQEKESNQGQQALREKYGIPAQKKVFTYLPTFRDHRETIKLSHLKGKSLENLLETLDAVDGVLVEKLHFADNQSLQSVKDHRLFFIDSRVDSMELLLITDVLISDYSSCYVDFSLLDRPMIHFLYDLEDYTTIDRGLYYPITTYRGGPIVKSLEELFEIMRAIGSGQDHDAESREKVRKKLLEYENDKSTEHILEVIKNRQQM